MRLNKHIETSIITFSILLVTAAVGLLPIGVIISPVIWGGVFEKLSDYDGHLQRS